MAVVRLEEPTDWQVERVTAVLRDMDSTRLEATFSMAADRFAQRDASGTVPDLLGVFEAAVRDTAPQ